VASREVWPPLRRWAAARLAGSNPAHWPALVHRAHELDSRAGRPSCAASSIRSMGWSARSARHCSTWQPAGRTRPFAMPPRRSSLLRRPATIRRRHPLRATAEVSKVVPWRLIAGRRCSEAGCFSTTSASGAQRSRRLSSTRLGASTLWHFGTFSNSHSGTSLLSGNPSRQQAPLITTSSVRQRRRRQRRVSHRGQGHPERCADEPAPL
jgi:hypothetical protein